MYLATNEFTGNGSTLNWNFNFSGGYLDPSHVKAVKLTAEGVPTTPLSLTLPGSNTARITPAVPAGQRFKIYRDTPKDHPMVDFSEGSTITEADLDLTTRQAVFAAAEMYDAAEQARAIIIAFSPRVDEIEETANSALEIGTEARTTANAALAAANSAGGQAAAAMSVAAAANTKATAAKLESAAAQTASAVAVTRAISAESAALKATTVANAASALARQAEAFARTSAYSAQAQALLAQTHANRADLSARAAKVSEKAAKGSAQTASSSAILSTVYADRAKAASAASGNVRFFTKYSDVPTALLPTGQVVHVFDDETKDGRQTRYVKENGALVFKTYPNQYGKMSSPITYHDQVVTETTLIPEQVNAWSFGPTLSLAPGVEVTVSAGSTWTVANGEVQEQ